MEPKEFLPQVAPLLHALAGLAAPGAELWLVGGALRDALCGRHSSDFDFATPYDPTALAKAFARSCGGSWFLMDRARHQSRVVVDEGRLSFDFAPFRAPTLEEDLRLRDFTLNALALDLCRYHRGEWVVVDPLGGKEDLEQGILRLCGPQAFGDDPLRMLRAVRLHGLYGYDLDLAVMEDIRRKASGLGRVAPERRTAEVARMLGCAGSFSALELMNRTALGRPIFGWQGDAEPILEEVRRFEEAAEREGGEHPLSDRLFHESLSDGFSRLGLMKLHLALGGTGKAAALKLSRKNTAVLRALASAALPRELPPSTAQRGRALWAESFQPAVVETLLMLLTGESSDEYRQVLRQVLADYLHLANDGRIPDLVDGQWIVRHLKIPPGPALGKMLDLLRKAEVEGTVATREEGENLLKSQAEKCIDNHRGGTYNPPCISRE